VAKYKMAAPDGNTYSIDGPDGASDDDVRNEILRQHPEAGTAPQPGVLDTIGGYVGAGMRGLTQGVTSLVTAPMDAAIGAVNAIKRAPIDPVTGNPLADALAHGIRALPGGDTTLDTNASDVIRPGLDKTFGRPQTPGQASTEFAGSLAGGAATGLPGLGGRAAAEAADATAGTGGVGNYWRWAADKGGMNGKIVNNAWGRQIGMPGETKLTSDVLNAADTKISKILDYGAQPGRFAMIPGQQAAQQIAQINEKFTAANNELLGNPTVQKLLKTLQPEKDVASGLSAEDVSQVGAQVGGNAQAALTAQLTPKASPIAKASWEDLSQIASQLGAAAKQQMSGKTPNYEYGQALFEAQDFVRGLIQSGMTKGEAAMYAQGRSWYRALHGQLLARTGNINPVTGDVNGQAVARFLQRTDKDGFALGRNQTPGYQAAREAMGQMGDTSLMETAANTHGDVGSFLKTIARLGPSAMQWVSQRGVPAAMQALRSYPGAAIGATAQDMGDSNVGQ
jgi:hypothetical protein